MARFCTKCGALLAEGARFCNKCGAVVEEVVPRSEAGANGGAEAVVVAKGGSARAGGKVASSQREDLTGGAVPQPAAAPRSTAAAQPAAVQQPASIPQPAPSMPDPFAYVPQDPSYNDPSAYAASAARAGVASSGFAPSAAPAPAQVQTPGMTEQFPAATAPARPRTSAGTVALIAAAAVAVVAAVVVGLFTVGPFGSSNASVAPVQGSVQQQAPAATTDQGDSASDAAADQQTTETPAQDEAATSEKVNHASTSNDDYVLPDATSHVYTTEELSGLSAWDLKVARNEIYARHGRKFNDAELQSYFDSKSWYHAQYSPEEFDAQSGILNDTELANVDVLRSAEGQ